MANTYTLIASNTVGSGGASSITFSGIPQTYTDLIVKVSARSDSAVYYTPIWMQINSITTGYTNKFIDVYNNAPTSATDWFGVTNKMPLGAATGASVTASTFSNCEAYIPNYAGSTYKSVSIDGVTENNSGSNNQWYEFLSANFLSNTAAISSLTLTLNAGNFVQYSTAYLYGIKKYAETGTGSKAIGGTVTTSGSYTIHTFTSTGMFTPTTSITGADVLIVAGGGGGGGNWGGGGGAGGFQTLTSQSYSSGVGYAAIVGAGGAGGIAALGNAGCDSSFSSTTSTGGGYGGYGVAGGNGGSGGGGGYTYGAGTGTSGQGNNGGSGASASLYATGGGGGAGAVGGAASGGTAGSGGAGTANSYSGSSVTYAGGGGGGGRTVNGNTSGSGGAGGGGAGGSAGGTTTPASNGQPGTANRGGGGGGSLSDGTSGNYTGGAGGSGIIIVRYTT